MNLERKIWIGIAGWAVPSQHKNIFDTAGTLLQRYAQVFNCVEINSSFYKDHKPDTYAKWAASTPEDFRFAVKLSKYFTQETRLEESGKKLKESLDGIKQLKEKLGSVLIQLPPSLEFNKQVVGNFLANFREHYIGTAMIEPRHTSWAQPVALDLLSKYQINKVLADPEPCPIPKSERLRVEGIRYYRLHGSPQIYKSRYTLETINRIATSLLKPTGPAPHTWVIFDNTTYGYAIQNALELQMLITGRPKDMTFSVAANEANP